MTGDTMNKHLASITKKLKLKPTEIETSQLTLSEILDRYKDRQRIVKTNNLFSFKSVRYEEVLIIIYSLKSSKGSLSYAIPVKTLKC